MHFRDARKHRYLQRFGQSFGQHHRPRNAKRRPRQRIVWRSKTARRRPRQRPALRARAARRTTPPAQTLAQTLQPASSTDLSDHSYFQCGCTAPPQAQLNGCARACICLLTHYIHTYTSFSLLSLSLTHTHPYAYASLFQTRRDNFAW